MKKAIIVVYHGSHKEEYNDKTSTLLTNHIKKFFSDFEVCEVFTSLIVHQRLEKKRFKFSECLEYLRLKKINQVYVLTTNLINGSELDNIKANLEKSNLDYKITKALLQDDISLNNIAHILSHDDKEVHLYVGHGSKRKDNKEYLDLEKAFIKNNIKNHYICVVDGMPTFEQMKHKLDFSKKIFIHPLMFISGYHAKRDVQQLAIDLVAKGLDAEFIDEALGEKEAIRNIYIDNLKKIL